MLAYCLICQISEDSFVYTNSVYSTPCNKQCQSCPFFELTKTLTAEARLSTGKSGMARLADSWEQRAVATERSCEILREGKGLSDQLASSSTTALRLSGTAYSNVFFNFYWVVSNKEIKLTQPFQYYFSRGSFLL